MNNDRELLELAAKGLGVEVWTDIDGNRYCGEPEREWNPLTDDAAALHLATKLRLDIMFFDGFEEVHCDGQVENDVAIIEPYGDDVDAAVRRAIVRAAAEIGRVMK